MTRKEFFHQAILAYTSACGNQLFECQIVSLAETLTNEAEQHEPFDVTPAAEP